MPETLPPEIGGKIARLFNNVRYLLLAVDGDLFPPSMWEFVKKEVFTEEYYKILKEHCEVLFCTDLYGVVLSCEGALMRISEYLSSTEWRRRINELCRGKPRGQISEGVFSFYVVYAPGTLLLSLFIEGIKPYTLPSYKDVTVQMESLEIEKRFWEPEEHYILRGYAYVGEAEKYAKLPSLSIDFKVLSDTVEIEYVRWEYEERYPEMPVKKPENFLWGVAEDEMFTEFWRLYYNKIEEALNKAKPILSKLGRVSFIYLLY